MVLKRDQDKRFYVFGGFRVDVEERTLQGQHGFVPLTPKAFETLLVLVENSGHVLSKDELMQKVWPDSFVEENNLAQNISVLRKVLVEQGGKHEKYIETVPKRGYRFTADVREVVEGAKEEAEESLDETAACKDEAQRRKRRSPLRDVILIGRAIDFK